MSIRRFALLMMSTTALLACSSAGSSNDDPSGDGGAAGASAAGGGGSGAAGGGSAGGGQGTVRTLQEFCDATVAAEKPWCDYLDKCCSATDRADTDFSPPVCAFGAGKASDCVASYQKAIDAGTEVYDGSWADACLAAIVAGTPTAPTTCSGLHAVENATLHHDAPVAVQVDACRKLFAGTVAKGAKCSYQFDCGPGEVCSTGTGTAGPTSCVAAGTTASPCIATSDCAAGLACVGPTPRHCGPLGDVGGPCLYGSDCKNGLLCNLKFQCVQPEPVGASCDYATDVCDGLAGCSSQSKQCTAIKADGQACTQSGECKGRCDDTTKTCTSICGGTI